MSNIEKPEIILKLQFEITDTDDGDIATPEILILSNRRGFEWLGEYFTTMAKKMRPSTFEPDPDDHQHLPFSFLSDEELNAGLSDRLAFRLGIFDASNRIQVLNKYGIRAQTAEHGCLTERLPELIEQAQRWFDES